jgi:hypothetical protein
LSIKKVGNLGQSLIKNGIFPALSRPLEHDPQENPACPGQEPGSAGSNLKKQSPKKSESLSNLNTALNSGWNLSLRHQAKAMSANEKCAIE